MSKKKYTMSGGLAFSENKDMERLRKFSLKGWHVNDFKFMGYTLEKGKSADYVYSVDYRSLKEDEAEEFFEFFASSGWTHISSEGYAHLFRALPGTSPIYSDRETVVEKHDNLGKPLRTFTISLFFITVLFWLGTLISQGSLQSTFTVIAGILSVIAIPTTWTVIKIHNNKWKAEGKMGLAWLMKSIPLLFLMIVSVIFLLSVDDLNNLIRVLISMFIGIIALPVAIWGIINLYYKFSSNL